MIKNTLFTRKANVFCLISGHSTIRNKINLHRGFIRVHNFLNMNNTTRHKEQQHTLVVNIYSAIHFKHALMYLLCSWGTNNNEYGC